MTRILGSSGSAIVASRRVRRRQDDHSTARPAHPSLRHHRNRKRKLALQKPRLTPTGSPTGAHRLPPAHRYVRLTAVTPRCAGPPYGLHGRPSAGVNIARRSRVKVQCRLTGKASHEQIATNPKRRFGAMQLAPGKPQLLCRSIEQAGDFGFDIAQARLSCSVVAVAAATGNGRRPASVLASRRNVECGFHALAGSTMR